MPNNLTRPLLSNQRSPRVSTGEHDSAVAKLQGLFCSISQTAQSIGNKLGIPSPRLSFGRTVPDRVCLKELLKQEENEEGSSLSASLSCSPAEQALDSSVNGKTPDYSPGEDWDIKLPTASSEPEKLAVASPLQQTIPVLKVFSARSTTSPKSLDMTQHASLLFDESTIDYFGDINANSIISSPTSDLALYKESPLTKVVRPVTLFSTPSTCPSDDESWIEPWYLLADNYRPDVSQALVRPLSFYLSTIPLDMTSSSFESGNGSVIDLSWDEFDMAALESPSRDGASAANRRSLVPVKMDEETLTEKKRRISLAACLKSPLSPLLCVQSPNSPLSGTESLRKLSKRCRRKLGTPLTLAAGRHQRRNYENETDEELVKILCDRDREIAKLKRYRDILLLRVVDVMPGSAGL